MGKIYYVFIILYICTLYTLHLNVLNVFLEHMYISNFTGKPYTNKNL